MLTLEQIQAKMKKLQVQADTLIAKKAQSAVDQNSKNHADPRFDH
jgi:hypothetical protein